MRAKRIFGIIILVIFCSLIIFAVCYTLGILHGSIVITSSVVSGLAIAKAVTWIIY